MLRGKSYLGRLQFTRIICLMLWIERSLYTMCLPWNGRKWIVKQVGKATSSLAGANCWRNEVRHNILAWFLIKTPASIHSYLQNERAALSYQRGAFLGPDLHQPSLAGQIRKPFPLTRILPSKNKPKKRAIPMQPSNLQKYTKQKCWRTKQKEPKPHKR